MKIKYYPGCTMKATHSNGKGFEASALASAEVLGLELVEMEDWYCCGTVYAMESEDMMNQLGSLRSLLEVQKAGDDKVVTMCSMCWHTLKLANHKVQSDPDKLETLNKFLDDEPDYRPEVEVYQLMELIRDEVGLDKLRKLVKNPLTGLKVAPYYGCVLTRPEEIAIDTPEYPTIMQEVMQALGATIVENPHMVECCGSYHTVGAKEIVAERTYTITMDSKANEAEIMVLSCPLCQYNLDSRQKETRKLYSSYPGMPVLYFTQLLALALGLDPKVCLFENHEVDPTQLLVEKGIIKTPLATH